ncbi:Glycine rich protein, partial [Prevotellaceae bacterium HUN156]
GGNIPYLNGTKYYYYTKPNVSTSFNSPSTEKEAWHEALVFNLAAGATTTLTAYSDRAYWDYINAVWNYEYANNNKYTFTAAPQGTYSYVMECWGAQGGNDADKPDQSDLGYGGKGGYTKGTLSLTASKNLYVYVGPSGVGSNAYSVARTNMGGFSTGTQGSGGGSTDIRTVNGNWNDFNSLKSRIMVAGGGGGAENNAKHGGAAGGTSGSADLSGTNKGGTQTSGYGFGIALYSKPSSASSVWGGGGNGYYSGYSDTTTHGGGGGSSFISGHSGCNAIKESSTSGSISHSGSPNHYSGLVFTSTQMIAGNATQTKPGGGTETGHSGNGYARITLTR